MRYTLRDLREGEHASVSELLPEGSLRGRLQDIGLIPGTQVTCLRRSPLGDPVAYLIRGAVIALRNEDAATVIVL